MNYLAHLFLSGTDESLIIGNMMTDMIKKSEEEEVSLDVLKGIELHRDIDHLTDSHDIFIRHKRTLYDDFGKYAPVVLDIIYDYYLGLNWTSLTSESFDQFEHRIYTVLIDNIIEFPQRVQPIVVRMVNAKWMQHYTSLMGIQSVFDRLERKVRFPQEFDKVSEIINDRSPEWEVDHLKFFEEIILGLQKRGWSIPQSAVKY